MMYSLLSFEVNALYNSHSKIRSTASSDYKTASATASGSSEPFKAK